MICISRWSRREVSGGSKTYLVGVLEVCQVVVDVFLLPEHGEHLLFGLEVVHHFGQGVGELWIVVS